MDASTDQLLELDNRRRTTIRVGRHRRYLAHEEPDGTLILRPAVVLTEDDIALRTAPGLINQINANLADPHARGTRRKLPTVKD